MLKIVVASKNPVKIETTLNGFRKMFPKLQFEAIGIEVASGVGNQPMNNDETYTGALNRVNAIYKKEKNADFWVGIEAGVAEKNGEMETFAWVVVSDKTGKFGKVELRHFSCRKKWQISYAAEKNWELRMTLFLQDKTQNRKMGRLDF